MGNKDSSVSNLPISLPLSKHDYSKVFSDLLVFHQMPIHISVIHNVFALHAWS